MIDQGLYLGHILRGLQCVDALAEHVLEDAGHARLSLALKISDILPGNSVYA